MARIAIKNCDSHVITLTPFEAGNMSATDQSYEMYSGRLPEPFRENFQAARRDGIIDYCVFSYSTPIAWVLADGTRIVPPVKYSQSTSRHQNIVRSAWGMEVA